MKTKAAELAKRHAELEKEIMENSNIPDDVKSEMIRIRKQFESEKVKYEEYLKKNEGCEIVGYNPENFKPIFKKRNGAD